MQHYELVNQKCTHVTLICLTQIGIKRESVHGGSFVPLTAQRCNENA